MVKNRPYSIDLLGDTLHFEMYLDTSDNSSLHTASGHVRVMVTAEI